MRRRSRCHAVLVRLTKTHDTEVRADSIYCIGIVHVANRGRSDESAIDAA